MSSINSVSHRFMRHLTDEQIVDGIEALPAAKLNRMVSQHLPGVNVNAANITEALNAADANFEVVKVPLRPIWPGEEAPAPNMDNRIGLFRSDTRQELGSAGPNYGVIQNAEAFAAADVLASTGEMAIQNIQVIDNGARVRVSGLIGSSVLDQLGRGPDVLAHFATFEANHDGIHGATGRLYTIRCVCLNGMTVLEKNNGFTVRHTSKAADRAKEAQAAFIKVSTAALEEAECFQELAQRRMNLESFKAFADELMIEIGGEFDEETTDRQRKARARKVEELSALFATGEGNVGMSAYDGYNAVTEWVAARRDKLADAQKFAKKFESQATGYHARTKTKALRILTR